MATVKQLPAELNIEAYEGDSYWPAQSILIVDQDGNAVTDFTPLMKVIDKSRNVVKTSVGFIVEGNKITINQQQDLPAGLYFHDLQITKDGKNYTQYKGYVKIQKDL